MARKRENLSICSYVNGEERVYTSEELEEIKNRIEKYMLEYFLNNEDEFMAMCGII